MNQLEKISRIEYSNYSVFDKNGKKICDCSSLIDALMMCSFDSTRTYRQVKVLSDQVVNIFSERMDDDKQLKSQNILPDREAIPVIV
jgi:hypothetical protein